eukprot:COSAG02_NODE_10379_length_1955_cov_0.910022_4_plen_81_part_00
MMSGSGHVIEPRPSQVRVSMYGQIVKVSVTPGIRGLMPGVTGGTNVLVLPHCERLHAFEKISLRSECQWDYGITRLEKKR